MGGSEALPARAHTKELREAPNTTAHSKQPLPTGLEQAFNLRGEGRVPGVDSGRSNP